MSNFKSGSGNLDFGGDETDSEDTDSSGEPQPDTRRDESTATEQPSEPPVASSGTDSTTNSPPTDDESTGESTSVAAHAQYPYFVRRNNVGDERETRLEIHVRDKVADREAAFRNELAEQLDTNEVSKTDAREFALLAAFEHPERVAELMADEGFGTL